jgi:4-hydroxy-tetrahydrodipicolinate synthase
MRDKQPWGIVTPILTPLGEGEAVDYAGLERLIDYLCGNGADGIFQISTTGEYARLPRRERAELARRTAEGIRGRAKLYLGVSDTSTLRVWENIRAAARFAPDYLVCSLPFYYPLREEGEALEFFTDVAEAARQAGIPLVLYNIPAACGAVLTLGVAARLAQMEGVAGIKDSGGDPAYLEHLLALKKTRPGFAVLCGDEGLLLEAARLGCDGLVPSSANVFPALFARLWRAVAAGQWPEAEALAAKVARANRLNRYSDSWLAPIVWKKAALARLGICGPRVTAPHAPLDAESGRVLEEVLAEYIGGM